MMKKSQSQARVKQPERKQIEWRAASLDQLIPTDHRVRVVWSYVDSLDLTPLYDKILAVAGHPGRDATDPKILLALWMFATIEGVRSGRQLARLCERDLAYMWICGGVGVNHHMLSDFFTGHREFLDQLLTDTIATLMHQGLVTLETVAQDGMRVRANAGSKSFRREPTLQECRDRARQQVQQREEESDDPDDESGSARRDAARERAAREREQRVQQALEELAKLQEQKEKQKKGSGVDARCSTTDPQARTMKMGDGGFRPAYNVQFVTDGHARMIVSVDVTNSGSDRGQMQPMYEDIRKRYAKSPRQYLVDGGFATKDDITALEKCDCQVFAPVQREEQMREKGQDPYARRTGDSDEMFEFRQRMATDQAKELFKQRPSIAEFPNAECRNRGLHRFSVRGLEKVKAETLWFALTFNFLRMIHLGCV